MVTVYKLDKDLSVQTGILGEENASVHLPNNQADTLFAPFCFSLCVFLAPMHLFKEKGTKKNHPIVVICLCKD